MLSTNFLLLRTAPLNRTEKKSLLFIFTSTYLDFYDFALFIGYAIYLAPVILPHLDQFEALLVFSAILAAGQLAKVVGIYLFNYYLASFRFNILLAPLAIGASYLVLAFLPSYALVGQSAAWLLLVLRIVQGLGFGYETGFAICHANLAFPQATRRYIYFFILLSGELGMLLSIFINRFIISQGIGLAVFEHVWRVQFLFGVILIVINLIFRQRYVRAVTKISAFHRKVFFYTLKYELDVIVLRAAIIFLQASLIIMAIFRMPAFLHRAFTLNNAKINHDLLLITMCGFIGSWCAKCLATKIPPQRLMSAFYGVILVINILFMLNHSHLNYFSLWLLFIGLVYGVVFRLTPLVLFPIHDFHQHNRLTGRYLAYTLGFSFFGSMLLLILDASRYFTRNYNDYAPELVIIFATVIGYCALKVYTRKYLIATLA